jgi:hypothetical protein
MHSMRTPVPDIRGTPRDEAIDEYDLVAFRDNVEHLACASGIA